jgi:hypothetical protein
MGPLVNLYIAELWVLFVGRETIEAQFSSREPAIQKVAKYGMGDAYMIYKNFMSILYKSTYLVCITHFSENF